MASFGQVAGDAVRQGICSILAVGNALEDFNRLVLNPNSPDYGYRGRVLYSNYCETPNPSPPPDPPFVGGQCEFCYSVTVGVNINDPGGPSNNGDSQITQGVYGPVSYLGVRVTQVSPGINRHEALFSTHGSCAGARQPNAVLTPITGDLLTQNGIYTIRFITVQPPAGVPDDCGNPPPELPPDDPDKRKFPIDFDFQYNDGTDFNITGNVFFGLAYFDTDFNLNVPLTFRLDNNVNFNANYNLDRREIVFNFGDEFDYPTPPPPEGDYRTDPDDLPPPPTNSPPPPSFDPPFPPPPPGEDDDKDFDDEEPQQEPKIRRIVGVLVDTVDTPPFASELLQSDNPDVYIPDIGLVNFGYLIDGNKFYWGEDIRVKNRRQVIFTPSGRYAVSVEGTFRQGGAWTLTPIYAEVKSQVGV